MDPIEQFVRISGEVGNFTKRITGTSIVDAYSGPAELAPERQPGDSEPEQLCHYLESLLDSFHDDSEYPLRRDYLIGETRSLLTVVKWLSGESISYLDLVKGILHIEVKQFSESVIKKQTEILEEAITSFPGETTTDKVRNFWKDGEIKGDELKKLLENDLQKKSTEVGQLFKDKVFSVLGQSVTDNGVEYKAVTDKPWISYNWYLGGFKSVNEFNVDKPFKKSYILSAIYHEYEHHVSSLWREQKYIDTNNLELSIVPLHSGRSVICEGTADTAMDFLQVMENSPQNKVEIALYGLIRMAQINAAIMLNHEGKSIQEVADYLVATDMRTEKQALGMLDILRATKADGSPNFWSPYGFSYYIGRTDFVKPAFTKAIENEALQEFYRTVYLNPYSGSSVTWKKAFEWL